jgi:hypothetical protein
MSRTRRRLASDVEQFIQQYGRRKPKRGEPNDRRYDRRVEHLVKPMDPRDLDALMHGEDDHADFAPPFPDDEVRTED